MPNTAKNASIQFKECEELFQKKLISYGTKDLDSLEQVVARMKEKISRIENLLTVKNKVEDESIEDTFLDLAGYSIIGRLIKMKLWGVDKECQGAKELLTINGQGIKDIGDVGYDLIAMEDTVIKPLPSLPTVVLSEVKVAIPKGYCCQIVGTTFNTNQLGLLVCTAVIDHKHRDCLFASCWNMSDKPITILKGKSMAQVIFCPVHDLDKREVKQLPEPNDA